MSTIADWQAAYNRIRLAYTWLPEGAFTPWATTAQAFFNGFDTDARAVFLVPLLFDVNEQVMQHESGHAAHSYAATVRDAAEGRGAAGDDIANEIAAILTGRSWTDPFDPLYKEYVAEAWRKANTGVTGPMGYPNPPGQVDPFPVYPLLAYFAKMAEPRVPPVQPNVSTIEWRGPLPESNFRTGRDGALVDRIVLHHMDGTGDGTEAWFKNPTSNRSSHFGVLLP